MAPSWGSCKLYVWGNVRGYHSTSLLLLLGVLGLCSPGRRRLRIMLLA